MRQKEYITLTWFSRGQLECFLGLTVQAQLWYNVLLYDDTQGWFCLCVGGERGRVGMRKYLFMEEVSVGERSVGGRRVSM